MLQKTYLAFHTHGTRMDNLFMSFCVCQTMLVSSMYSIPEKNKLHKRFYFHKKRTIRQMTDRP